MIKDKQRFLPRYTVRLCSDKAAFEVKLHRRLRLDLESVKEATEDSEDYEVTMYTPHILILRSRTGVEITLSRDGRMLIKKLSSKDEVSSVAKSVLQMVMERSPPEER